MSESPSNDPEADRQAVERIIGHRLPTEWSPGAMPPGSRVRVIRSKEWDGPWRREFSGTIDSMAAPEPVRQAHAREGEFMYWVAFDEAQYDSSGDGPYRKAQIWGRYLRPE